MAFTSNIESVIAQMSSIGDDVELDIRKIIHHTLIRIDKGVHEKTPVWSGLAVRNMIWSINSPNMTEYPAIPSGDVTDGSRRSANTRAARSTLDQVLGSKTTYGVFYLSNAAEHIAELEAGKLPSPEASRVPSGGMFGLTYAEVRASIGKGM